MAGGSMGSSISKSVSMPALSLIIFLILIILLLLGERSNNQQAGCPVCRNPDSGKYSALATTEAGAGKKLEKALQDIQKNVEKEEEKKDVEEGDKEVAITTAAPKDDDDGKHKEYDDGCKDGYHLSYLLSRYIDIDFIEFVLGNHPKPHRAKVLDIGIYEAGGLIEEAKKGFNIEAYEASPGRYEVCMKELKRQPQEIQDRIKLKNYAISDSKDPLCFQNAGLDGHMYPPEGGKCMKEKSITVDTVPMSEVVEDGMYFIKIDTQGFDTRILENLLTAIESKNMQIPFIQFEFTPHFEVTRAKRTPEDHKKILRRIQDMGYDLFQGGAVQPWKSPKRAKYGKSPLALLAIEREMPTCVDAFVDRMHDKDKAIVPGQSSTGFGMWLDILAVKRMPKSPYYRQNRWVLARHM